MGSKNTGTKTASFNFDFIGEFETRNVTEIGNGAHVYVKKDWKGKRIFVILPKE